MAKKPAKAVAQKPVRTVKMHRPEDRSVIVDVPKDKVAYWQSHGWAVKE